MQRQNSVELIESIRARLLDPSWLDRAAKADKAPLDPLGGGPGLPMAFAR